MWDKMVVEADLTGEWPGGEGGGSSSYKTTQATPVKHAQHPLLLPQPYHHPFSHSCRTLHHIPNSTPGPPGKTLPPPPPPQPSTRPPQALKRLNPHLCVIRRALVFNQEIVAEPAPGLGLDLADLRVEGLNFGGGGG